MTCRMRSLLPMLAVICLGLVSGISCSRGPETGEAGPGPHQEAAGAEDHAEGGDEDGHEEGVVELTPEAHARAGIETALVGTQALGGELETTGEVGFNEDLQAHVGPRIAGRITAVHATLGQRVRRGETLAVLDSTELGQAKASYAQARAQEELTRETFERERRLAAERISSQQEMLAAQAAHREASAELERAEATLRLLGLSTEQIESLRAGDTGSSLSPIASPLSGTVVDKEVTLGQMVSPDQHLFTVADLSRLWIWIDVFEKDVGRVHLEDDASIEVDSYPGTTFEGKVSFLASSVDSGTRTVRARVDAENGDQRLRPGMFARIRLADPHARPAGAGVPVVPESALQRDGDGYVAFVVDGERRYRRREVEPGRQSGDWVEVLGGLAAGEQVVVKGAFLLASEAAKETMGEGHGH